MKPLITDERNTKLDESQVRLLNSSGDQVPPPPPATPAAKGDAAPMPPGKGEPFIGAAPAPLGLAFGASKGYRALYATRFCEARCITGGAVGEPGDLHHPECSFDRALRAIRFCEINCAPDGPHDPECSFEPKEAL